VPALVVALIVAVVVTVVVAAVDRAASIVSAAMDANAASASVGGRDADNAANDDEDRKKLTHLLVLIMARYL
jgi:hypothetical protein